MTLSNCVHVMESEGTVRYVSLEESGKCSSRKYSEGFDSRRLHYETTTHSRIQLML
jgi:hypothetical protein